MTIITCIRERKMQNFHSSASLPHALELNVLRHSANKHDGSTVDLLSHVLNGDTASYTAKQRGRKSHLVGA